MSLIPVPLDEAVGFVTVSLPLFHERVGQALTRAAVKELVRRTKTANVTANGIVDLATDIAGPTDFAAASRILALYELYSGTRREFAAKAWVGNADAEMAGSQEHGTDRAQSGEYRTAGGDDSVAGGRGQPPTGNQTQSAPLAVDRCLQDCPQASRCAYLGATPDEAGREGVAQPGARRAHPAAGPGGLADCAQVRRWSGIGPQRQVQGEARTRAQTTQERKAPGKARRWALGRLRGIRILRIRLIHLRVDLILFRRRTEGAIFQLNNATGKDRRVEGRHATTPL